MKFSLLIKLTTQVILVENEGGQSISKGGTRSWKITKKCKFMKYATHCQYDYKVTGGLEWDKKVCVCCFCIFSVSLEWTGLPLMRYGFCSGKIWQRPCSVIPAYHGNIPLHHKLPLHSVKVFFVPSEMFCLGTCSIKAIEVLSLSSGKVCSTSPT